MFYTKRIRHETNLIKLLHSLDYKNLELYSTVKAIFDYPTKEKDTTADIIKTYPNIHP